MERRRAYGKPTDRDDGKTQASRKLPQRPDNDMPAAVQVKGSLLKTLTAIRAGSRRQIADAIKGGRVTVNGAVVADFSLPVDLSRDIVLIAEKRVQFADQRRLILMLNKPPGIVTTTSDEQGRTTVMDILPPPYRNMGLYPVGRLDKESTGLLLITNDGSITYRLTHPKFEHEKEYLVAVSGRLPEEEISLMRKGIMLDDGMTAPSIIKEIRGAPPFNYRVTVHEGKKRQIRRMFESLGYRVTALKRIRFGGIMLGTLPEGQTRELTEDEIKKLIG